MPITSKGNLTGKITKKGKLRGHVSIKPIMPNLQNKDVEINQNGAQTIIADEGYNGLNQVEITTNVTPNLQNKSVEITQNTTTNISADNGYDGLGIVEITTNVSSHKNAYINPTINVGTYQVMQSIVEFPDLTIGESVTKLEYLFNYASSLVHAPQMNTSNIFSFSNMFANCTSLAEVPEYNTSMISMRQGFVDVFKNCPSLSYGSLNNIMAMCINATRYNYNKTLKNLGLSQEQATTCQSLSNWDEFVNAGWSTGY